MIVSRVCHFNTTPLPDSIDTHVGPAIILQINEGLIVSRLGIGVPENGILGLYTHTLSVDSN